MEFGMLVLFVVLAVVPVCAWFHGLCLFFQANVFLGIVAFFFPPVDTLVRLIEWLGHFNVALALAKALGLH